MHASSCPYPLSELKDGSSMDAEQVLTFMSDIETELENEEYGESASESDNSDDSSAR